MRTDCDMGKDRDRSSDFNQWLVDRYYADYIDLIYQRLIDMYT
jgi:hypothetical protein